MAVFSRFLALFPGKVERRACVASTIIGDDVIIFTASVLATRWPKISDVVAEMVVSVDFFTRHCCMNAYELPTLSVVVFLRLIER